jgi:predicted small lipoprotein YifL
MRVVCLLAAICLLAGCGLKGPLTLPQQPAAPQADKKVQP